MDKPDLLTVLRHFGADVNDYRVSQLIRCIVHDEQRASMSVNSTKGLVNCMACGFAGDVYSIVMKKEGISFAASQHRAAEIAGSPAPVPARRRRAGLSGEQRAGRRGWKPRTRRGLSDPET